MGPDAGCGCALGVAALIAAAVLAVAMQPTRAGGRLIYLVSLAVSLVTMAVAGMQLLDGADAAPAVRLPVGLPWIGARFRMDALSAFFLVLANLGAAGASLFAIGYGAHEQTPGRVLPLYPVYLAAMNLVVLADDTYSFIVLAAGLLAGAAGSYEFAVVRPPHRRCRAMSSSL